jgi:hypothetical protein
MIGGFYGLALDIRVGMHTDTSSVFTTHGWDEARKGGTGTLASRLFSFLFLFLFFLFRLHHYHCDAEDFLLFLVCP